MTITRERPNFKLSVQSKMNSIGEKDKITVSQSPVGRNGRIGKEELRQTDIFKIHYMNFQTINLKSYLNANSRENNMICEMKNFLHEVNMRLRGLNRVRDTFYQKNTEG